MMLKQIRSEKKCCMRLLVDVKIEPEEFENLGKDGIKE